MSIQERVEKWLEPGERILAVGAETFTTNVQHKQSRTEQRISHNRKRVTTRSWKEFASDGIPVLLTDRRMVRLGDAARAGTKVGDEVWRLYKELDHQVPYSDLRSFSSTVDGDGMMQVRLVPLVGRECRIGWKATEEPERDAAIKALAERFSEGGELDETRRRDLVRAGVELVDLREQLTEAIRTGRLPATAPLVGVGGLFTLPVGLGLGVFSLFIAQDVLRAITRGYNIATPAFFFALFALLGAAVCLVAVGAMAWAVRGVVRSRAAQSRERELVARMAKLLGVGA